MEKKTRSIKKDKPPLKTRLLLGLATFAFIFAACGTINQTQAVNETLPIPTQSSSIQLNSVTVSSYQPNAKDRKKPGKVEVIETEPLEASFNLLGIINGVNKPSQPCGDPNDSVISTLDENTILINERNLLCDNLSTLSLLFNWNLTREEIEKLASNIIILDKDEKEKVCIEDASGCQPLETEASFVEQLPSAGLINHELVHTWTFDETPYYSYETNYCYTENGNSFSITYPDPNNSGNNLTINADVEFLSTVVEQFTISSGLDFNLATGIQSNVASYLLYNDEKDPDSYIELLGMIYRFGQGFISLNPKPDTTFIIKETPSLSEIAPVLEKTAKVSGVDLINLINMFNRHVAHVLPLRHTYNPPSPSLKKPINVCIP